MKKTQLNIICFASWACLLNMCSASNPGICSIHIKMDGTNNRIAFCVGDLKQKSYLASGTPTDVFILEIEDKSVNQIISGKDVYSLGWRSLNGESELWVSVLEERFGLWTTFNLIYFRKNIAGGYVTKTIKSPDLVSGLQWNPNGKILAGQPKRDYQPPLFNKSSNYFGSVGISFRNGKQARVYLESRVVAARLFWKNENSFYTEGIRGKKILEFLADSDEFTVTKTTDYGEKVALFGVYDGKPVYRLNGDVYIGDELVYDSDTSVGWVKVSKPYLSFVENSSIVIANIEEGGIIRKDVEQAEIVNIGLAPQAGKIYWLSDVEEICCWDFKKQNSIESIYEISTGDN